jgi:hypothetical protein
VFRKNKPGGSLIFNIGIFERYIYIIYIDDVTNGDLTFNSITNLIVYYGYRHYVIHQNIVNYEALNMVLPKAENLADLWYCNLSLSGSFEYMCISFTVLLTSWLMMLISPWAISFSAFKSSFDSSESVEHFDSDSVDSLE